MKLQDSQSLLLQDIEYDIYVPKIHNITIHAYYCVRFFSPSNASSYDGFAVVEVV